MQKVKNHIFDLLYIGSLPILLLDTFRSRATVHTYLGISSFNLEIVVLMLLVLFRIFLDSPFHQTLSRFNKYVVFPISFVVGISFTFWDYYTPSNYVYSLTYVQYTHVCYIAIFSALVWLMGHDNAWFKRHYKKIIFGFSLSYLLTTFVFSSFPRDIFAKLSQEDNVVENAQVIVLLLGCFWAIKLSRLLYKNGEKLHAFVFVIMSFALFFVAGDEISWGQRIFHFTTPMTFKALNDQSETTIHNLKYFSGYVRTLYIFIGFYGSVAWASQLLLKKLNQKPFFYYIPPWFCALFYFSGFSYNYFTDTIAKYSLYLWAESAELMLYSGMSLTILAVLIQRARKN